MKVSTKENTPVHRVFPVCYFDKHFVNSSPDNHHFIWEKKWKVFEILEHKPLFQSIPEITVIVTGPELESVGEDKQANQLWWYIKLILLTTEPAYSHLEGTYCFHN